MSLDEATRLREVMGYEESIYTLTAASPRRGPASPSVLRIRPRNGG